MAISNLLLTTSLAGIAGLGLGGLLGTLFRRQSNHTLCLLLSFSGGIIISLVFFDLLQEAAATGVSALWILGGILAGIGIIHLLHQQLDQHLSLRNHKGSALRASGILMACAIGLHNIPEGMTMGASYVGAGSILTNSGMVLALFIGLHNLPEGMAMVVPLVGGGMRRSTAVLIAAFSGVPTVLGAVLGYVLGDLGPVGLAVSLSLASGTLLYVIFGEVLPQAIAIHHGRVPFIPITLGILLGLLVLAF